ncbi:MAG: hypothetical protein ACRCWM_09590 [Sarcina sp.]
MDKHMTNHIGEEVSLKYLDKTIVINNEFYLMKYFFEKFSTISFFGLILLIPLILDNIGTKYTLKTRKLISLYLLPIFLVASLGIGMLLYLKGNSLYFDYRYDELLGGSLAIGSFIYSVLLLIRDSLNKLKF